jgi:hypothetical protein
LRYDWIEEEKFRSHDWRQNVSKHMKDEQTAGAMPAGNMASLTGQPGDMVDAMPAGAMVSETGMAEAIMPDGQPGEQGEMPSDSPSEAGDSVNSMPAGAMVEGQAGVEGDMPSGSMEAAPPLSDEAPSAEPGESPLVTITGNWQLTMWASQITRG